MGKWGWPASSDLISQSIARLFSGKDTPINTSVPNDLFFHILLQNLVFLDCLILANLMDLKVLLGFPGGAVVKKPPANAGDTGSSPGPGRSHMPWSNKARAPQLLNLRSRARVPQLLKPSRLEPVLRNKRSHRSEKPVCSNEDPMQTCSATREATAVRSPCAATKTQCSQK